MGTVRRQIPKLIEQLWVDGSARHGGINAQSLIDSELSLRWASLGQAGLSSDGVRLASTAPAQQEVMDAHVGDGLPTCSAAACDVLL